RRHAARHRAAQERLAAPRRRSRRRYLSLASTIAAARLPAAGRARTLASHMKFLLIDDILEQSDQRLVALKQVSLAEEYLGDHFPGFPVLPGVMMVEAMAQAARTMLAPRGDAQLVLGEVKALKFGNFVRPGQALRVEVVLDKQLDGGA